MIEFLLSDIGHPFLVSFLITITIIPFFILGLYNKITYRYKTSILSAFVTSVFVTLFAMLSLFIAASTKFEYVSDENWKQIYTNDNDTKVIITNSSQYGIRVHNDLIAGDKLSADYKLFTVPSKADIKIKKDDVSYSKKVRIEKDNIVINGDLNEDSKITKIEYKNIQGYQRSLFGYKGPIEKDEVKGELRITIEQDSKQKELKQMFENKE